jgi:hypothetical protein
MTELPHFPLSLIYRRLAADGLLSAQTSRARTYGQHGFIDLFVGERDTACMEY